MIRNHRKIFALAIWMPLILVMTGYPELPASIPDNIRRDGAVQLTSPPPGMSDQNPAFSPRTPKKPHLYVTIR